MGSDVIEGEGIVIRKLARPDMDGIDSKLQKVMPLFLSRASNIVDFHARMFGFQLHSLQPSRVPDACREAYCLIIASFICEARPGEKNSRLQRVSFCISRFRDIATVKT